MRERGVAAGCKFATRTRPDSHGIEGRQTAQQFGSSRADQAGEAENLAAAQFEVHARGALAAIETFDRQQRFARRVRHLREEFVDAAADHQRDDLALRHAAQLAAADGLRRRAARCSDRRLRESLRESG